MLSCGSKNDSRDSVVFSSHESYSGGGDLDLCDIQNNGELIVLTLYGPLSYFEFRGENFGAQYMLADEYANSIGVSLRVDVCHSLREMLDKLEGGDGDVIAYNINVKDSMFANITFCGQKALTTFLDSLRGTNSADDLQIAGDVAWAVRKSSVDLATSLTTWMDTNKSRFGVYTTIRQRRSNGVKRRGRYYAPRRSVAAPILNVTKGQISIYDDIFKTYSSLCGWDWKLIAAQAYQESGFDNNAVSWMGALGLMQLMPSTAAELGVGEDRVFNAEVNLKAAVRLIKKLNAHYSYITDTDERINFVLAAYNAGPGHVDDARRLCKKHGLNPNVWKGNVAEYVLKMSSPYYYNDKVVEHGYFRGSETYGYVNSIRSRWDEYRRKIR